MRIKHQHQLGEAFEMPNGTMRRIKALKVRTDKIIDGVSRISPDSEKQVAYLLEGNQVYYTGDEMAMLKKLDNR